MEIAIKNNLIESYQTDGGFIVHNCEMLRKLFRGLNINPKTSVDSRIFELEGITHFFQHGVIVLAQKLEITKKDYVLSLGEGSGAPSRLLVKNYGCRVIGVDINPDQIIKARESAVLHGVQDRVKYFEQDVEELSLQKKDFTKAFCNETCCHWQEKEKSLRRIRLHLKKKAKIGFNAWIRGDKGTLNEAYNSIPAFRNLYKKGIWFQEKLKSYEKLLKQSGFNLIEIYDCTDKIDLKIRARLKASEQWDRYEAIMGKEARKSGFDYYASMLKTHYDFLRYGVIIAENSCK